MSVCVLYTVRSDKAQNWWFVAPPPADVQHRSCSPGLVRKQSSEDGVTTVHISLDGLHLPVGYSRVNVVLEQPRNSTTPLVPPLDAVVAVVHERAQSSLAWLPTSSRAAARLDESAVRALAESYRIVREDERAEKEEYARRTAAGRDRYMPLHAWDELPQPSTAALRGVLDRALLAALEHPTPAALWSLVRTPDPLHPVHQIRLFSPEGAERLATELAYAHATNLPTGPTNNERQAPLPHQTVVRDGPPSLLLDEVRLHAVAHALAAAVLAPLSRLLYPEWTAGGQLDSYHAFTIHRRSRAANQDSWFRPSSNSEGVSRGGAAAAAANGVTNATAAAAVSLNVALRTTGDLVGTRVGFEPGMRGIRAGASDVLWLGHEAGIAFLNLCQQRHGVEPLVSGGRDTVVVRGFASAFRRAPAEGFYEQCVAHEPHTAGKDEV